MTDFENKLHESKRILKSASKEFGDKIYALSSFGADSSVLLRLIELSEIDVSIITIDTGFLFDETNEFKKQLVEKYKLDLITTGPSENEISEIIHTNMWTHNKDKYHYLAKLKPLENIMKQLKIKALISGVRHDQTKNRAKLKAVDKGKYGEARIHPIIKWSQKDVDSFILQENLPRHPLVGEYASIGDWTTTRPGSSRAASRKLTDGECGLVVAEGRIVNTKG